VTPEEKRDREAFLSSCDDTHRELPAFLMSARFVRGQDAKAYRGELCAVVRSWYYGPFDTTHGSPLIPYVGHIRAELSNGTERWFGCKRAYINSALRMILVGHPLNDEVRQRWTIVKPEGFEPTTVTSG